MNAYMMATADKIKSLRRVHGMTQEDLAAKSGCGPATIQRAESGKRMSADTIASLAAAFDIPASDLTFEAPMTFEPYLPLGEITTGRPLVRLLLGRPRIDFDFCELNNLEDAKAIELFHGFCQALAATEVSLSPIALVKRELEGRDHLVALSTRGFRVGGAEFEIMAYEIDDDDGGGIAICLGQWDERCVALRVGQTAVEITRAHVLAELGKWEAVKGDAVVYPSPTRTDDDVTAMIEPTSPSSEET